MIAKNIYTFIILNLSLAKSQKVSEIKRFKHKSLILKGLTNYFHLAHHQNNLAKKLMIT